MKIQPSGCQRIPLPPPCQQLPANTFTPPCQQLPANTFTPTLSAVASEYLYPHPVSSCQRIPLPPPCKQLPADIFTPTLSAVASQYLCPHPVSRWQRIPLRPPCQQSSFLFLDFGELEKDCMNGVKSSWHVARMQFIPVISVFPVISHPSHLCYHISFLLTVSLFILLQEKFLQFDCLEQLYFSIIRNTYM